jgi:hypothetical protein
MSKGRGAGSMALVTGACLLILGAIVAPTFGADVRARLRVVHRIRAVPSIDHVHVRVRPRVAGPRTRIELSFRAARTLQADQAYDVETATLGSAEDETRCNADFLRYIRHAHRGRYVRITMRSGDLPWCLGRYRASVFLLTRPFGSHPASRRVGVAHFRVVDSK